MINESKKRDPRMHNKWKESGAMAMHPEQYRREQKAKLEIVEPNPLHNNWGISFRSVGKSKDWRDAYAYTIMDLAEEKNWMPFFQSGSVTEMQDWQYIELWKCKEPTELESFMEDVHKQVQEKYPKLFIQ